MFGQRKKPSARAIALSQWQDPVNDVAVVFSEGTCCVYFFVRDSELLGKLSFDGVWAIRGVRTEIAPYMDRESHLGSHILEVFDSLWPSEIECGFYGEQSKKRLHKESRHFLVKGHDIYHEILCTDYSEQYLSKTDEEYPFALRVLGTTP